MKRETLGSQEGICFCSFLSLNSMLRRSNSRESERKPYHQRALGSEEKERLRESYRDRSDSARPISKFKNDSMAGSNLVNVNWNQTELIPFQKNFYTVFPSSF